MTRDRSFKRLVRARMGKTGESYTAARAALLAAATEVGRGAVGAPRAASAASEPVLATSDDEIRRRTGRGWEEWFDLLDEWAADQLPHRDVARRVAADLGIEPLVWEAQAVTYSYERARGLRAANQRADGTYTVTASKTVAVPIDDLFAWLAEPSRRARWLPDDELTERTSIAPRSIRFDWAGGRSRVTAVLDAKGAAKARVTLEHSRLAGPDDVARMKDYWRGHLSTLKSQLEADTGQRG